MTMAIGAAGIIVDLSIDPELGTLAVSDPDESIVMSALGVEEGTAPAESETGARKRVDDMVSAANLIVPGCEVVWMISRTARMNAFIPKNYI